MLIVDSSILLAALLPEELGPDLEELIAAHDELLAPALLWVEVRNIVLTAERRGRMTGATADSILEAIDDLAVTLDTAPRSDAVMRLARAHQLSAYDALYLELALRHHADLATLDRALRLAAIAEGVDVAAG